MTVEGGILDIVGPIMIGPSSSHTAGAVRLGLMARNIFGKQPGETKILLHGSFAATGKGHGTDKALVAGLLGWAPDDLRLPKALEEAEKAGLKATFTAADLGDVHPNTAHFILKNGQDRIEIRGSSIGGGKILITNIGNFAVELSGSSAALIVSHQDRPGAIAAVTRILAELNVNISAMRVSRCKRGADAMMVIEMDQLPETKAAAYIQELTVVEKALILKPVAFLGVS